MSKKVEKEANLYVFSRYKKDELITWEDYYEFAKIYYEHNGNSLIPITFKTKDGYTYDEKGISLGKWMAAQRMVFEKLTEERKWLLQSIDLVLDPFEEHWQKNYKLAKKYYEHNGNSLIPVTFKTKDGYSYDENGIRLGKWMVIQRMEFEKLSEEHKKLLKSIGFILEPYEEEWQQNFELAKKYYEHNGNLLIPRNFITKDGYTYDENGIRLGIWVTKQRQVFERLSEKRRQMLLAIGIVFNVKNNKEEVQSLCLENNIDILKNKYILRHIAIQELKSKIEFLKAYNKPVVDESGELVDIFSMSSEDTIQKYGVSLEKLICEYYVKNEKKKSI